MICRAQSLFSSMQMQGQTEMRQKLLQLNVTVKRPRSSLDAAMDRTRGVWEEKIPAADSAMRPDSDEARFG